MPKHGDNKPSARAVSNLATSHSDKLLTKQQAAEYLQTTTRYVERMVSSGRMRAFKPTGGLFRVRQSDLNAFLEAGSSIETAEVRQSRSQLAA